MPVPPPPPPPPPPPAPSVLSPLSVKPGITGSQSSDTDRSKLLSEIQTGLKLRKTVTNDRSAPVIGGKVSNTSETNSRMVSSGGSKVPAVGGVSGLFVNGIPKKPSDNKKNQASVFKGVVSNPPLLPKPCEMYSAKPVIHSESQEQQFSPSVAECSETSSAYRQTSAGIAGRLKQFNQISRPGLAPPTPPSLKTKPMVKEVTSPLIKKISIPEQFKTLRPNKPANDASPLRRSGSSDDIRNSQSSPESRNTPPPNTLPLLNTSNSTRIPKPACPPPPPPNQASRMGLPLAQPSNYFTPVSSRGIPFNTSFDEDPPPPPPPPRITSRADQMDRFTFIPINELPPPEIFSGIKKVYEYHPPRKIQIAPSSYH